MIGPSQLKLLKKIKGAVLIPALLGMLTGLGGYAYLGSFMRYSGDDYCYGRTLTQIGFWNAQVYSFTHVMPYHGNRYMLTFFSDLAGLFDPWVSGLLPALALAAWILGLYLLLRSAFACGWTGRAACLLAASTLVFFTSYEAPDLVQSLYWRSGLLTYLAGLIGLVFNLAWIFRGAKKTSLSPIDIGGVVLLALVAGGFSETADAFQAGMFGLLLGYALLLKRDNRDFSRRLMILAGVGLGTAFVVLGLLAFSPAIIHRLTNISTDADILWVLTNSLVFSWNFLVESAKGLVLANIVLAATFGTLGYLFAESGEKRLFPRLLGLCAGTYWMTFCVMVPTAYSYTAYPEPRTLILGRFIWVGLLAAAGWLLGSKIRWLVRRFFPVGGILETALAAAACLALLGVGGYAARAAYQATREAPDYQRWTAFWEERDAAIRAARDAGQTSVEVVQIDHIVPRVGELGEDPTGWYNACAAGYYGLDSITADLPGWE